VQRSAGGVSRVASYDPLVADTERLGDRTQTGRGSDRPVLVIAALALVAVVALSALVGFVGSPHTRFGWELASIFGTALGTTLLAAATGWLAWSTRSEVRATQRLAELTREQYAASERPVVLQRNASWNGTPENGYLAIDLLNVGLGPALRVRVSASYVGHPDWQPTIEPASATIPAIEPNASPRIELPVRFPEPHKPEGVRGDGFRVVGTYLDRSMQNEDRIITSWPE
jgi:hypothetical protein